MVKPKTFKCPHCGKTCRKGYENGIEVNLSYSSRFGHIKPAGWFPHDCYFRGEENE